MKLVSSKVHLALILSGCAVLFWLNGVRACWGGQIVNNAVRAWARQAIQQEKSLTTRQAAERTLAVLYFHNKTGWNQLKLLQKGLAIMLMTDLSKVKEIQLVERARIQALVEELGFGVSGLVLPDQEPRVARLLGANLVVGGDIVREHANDFAVQSGLLNVMTENMLGKPMVKGKLLDELFRMEKDLLFQIIRLLKIELSPALEAELKEPMTGSMDALLHLFGAIEQSDEGHLKDAQDLLDQSLKEDPDFGLSQGIKGEIAEIFRTDRPAGGGGSSGGGSDIGGITRKQKECAALRNKLRRSSFRRRRF